MLSPKFVIDAPGGGGKVPLVPDYVESREDGALWVRSFNGKLYRYPER
jgi:lysine 2,3-aminomutase